MKLRETLNKLFFGRKAMTDQVKNYTDDQVSMMVDTYVKSPTRDTVDMIANKLGKTARSVIAKLSREGVYVAQPKVTKSGAPIVTKAELVSRIEEALQSEMPTLAKASKTDLQKLVSLIG